MAMDYLTGRYSASSVEALEIANFILAQSFGTRDPDGGPGSVNHHLSEATLSLFDQHKIPVIAQEEVSDALRKDGFSEHLRIEGSPSSSGGQGLDSWGVLLSSQVLARDRLGLGEGELRPIIVAQAFHVGRIALQAQKLGMDPRIPTGLPRQFAPDSAQWWTRSRTGWVAREGLGRLALKLQGKL